MPHCRICQTHYEPFISFGKMPIANGFLTPEQFKDEYFFDLKAGCCPNCHMVQIVEQPDHQMMFHENYAFFSSTSTQMALHFKRFAESVVKDYLKSQDPLVVEIGSNDGIMLQHFVSEGIRHLGIEPSANVAQVAIDKGIETVRDFFEKELALKLVEKYGQADAFLGANVMCHIPYIHSVIEGIKILLKPDGIVQFEDPYLGDVIENTSYDQIYDEHVFLFSVSSIKYLFDQHDMEVIDVKPQDTHGGSMRYIISRKGAYPASVRVRQQLKKEEMLRLNESETFEAFRNNCEHSKDSLMELLNVIRQQGQRIVGYAATSKSTTIINYCGITNSHIDFISDTTSLKHGKYSPGAHIPVRTHEEFTANYPDYALLFAYNHAKEIMAKEKKFVESGGKWILYIPEVQILK
ncbi:MAG: methyltransferase domain-containing protein [Candidatus Hodarchaeota archaeon]